MFDKWFFSLNFYFLAIQILAIFALYFFCYYYIKIILLLFIRYMVFDIISHIALYLVDYIF